MKKRLSRRRGFTLVEVMLACVILSIGLLGVSSFYSNELTQLSPQGGEGGLRLYLVAEELVHAEAEALRATQYVWNDASKCKLVTEPPNSGYTLTDSIPVYRDDPNGTSDHMQYLVHDIKVTMNGSQVAGLTLTTLRCYTGGPNAKAGL